MHEARTLLGVLTEQQLLIDSNPLCLETHQGFELLSWNNKANLSYLFGEYSTLDHYLKIIENRDFVFLFADGGVIQLYYKLERDTVSKHRLCYYPCPYAFDPQDWEGISISEIPSLMSAEDLIQNIRLATPIRFDFDANFSDDKHAHSHVTLNKDTCRVPAYGPISLGHFSRFIIRYFYEGQIPDGEDGINLSPTIYKRTLGTPIHEMHFDTSIGW
jgi:hypothetical protein